MSSLCETICNSGKLKEACGVFGIFDNDGYDVARITYYALYALQHRGQESCGIAVNDEGTIVQHKDMGLVPEVFNDVVLNHLKGQIAVGHCMYSSASSGVRENAQPLVTKYVKGTLTLAHNGSLVNADAIRAELENQGAVFQTTNDAELIANLIARNRVGSHSVEAAVAKTMESIKGAYSLVLSSPRKLIAVRDPNGFRPLCMGKIGNSYVFASETCALDTIGATFVRDVMPGEIVVVSKEGVSSYQNGSFEKSSLCIFEYVYFARPDSFIHGSSVYEARKEAGRYLAKEHPVDADLVIGVPDSGLSAAIGYAEEAKIPYETGFIKNRYIGRTFIQPTQELREIGVQIKLNALKSTIKGRRVVMVDDSIVRGTTSRRIVDQLRAAGATEVHVRVSAPPFKWPCYFGTDIPSKDELIACRYSTDEICEQIGADSLGFLSEENLKKIVKDSKCKYCSACFSGKYPIDVSR